MNDDDAAGQPAQPCTSGVDIVAERHRRVAHRREDAAQLSLLTPPSPVLGELLSLDVSGLTPLEAINRLYELQERARAE